MADQTAQPESENQDPENPEFEDVEPEYTVRKPRRRRKRDIVKTIAGWISIFCWGTFVAAMVFIDQATPEMQNVFSRHLELELREEWDLDAVANALNLMYWVAGFSFIVTALKLFRRRRKDDMIPYIFIILFVVSVIGIFMLQGKLPVE